MVSLSRLSYFIITHSSFSRGYVQCLLDVSAANSGSVLLEASLRLAQSLHLGEYINLGEWSVMFKLCAIDGWSAHGQTQMS